MITKKSFIKAWNANTTIPDMALMFDVSESSIKNYSKIFIKDGLILSRGKGNRVNHKRVIEK